MQIIQGVRTLSAPFSGSILTIGNFDGVHLGHQALVGRVVERAKETGLPSVVMTFEPHPVKVLQPNRQLKRIFDHDDQVEALEKLGVDVLVIEPFSREFSQLEPERYLLEWIYRPFAPETLIVGYDFSFGVGRRGSIDFLKERAANLGFKVEVVAPVKVGDVLASSSRVRQALEAGDVRLATTLLGRRFYVTGLVEKGAGRGRTIGVPTANVTTPAETIPARGVYAAFAKVRDQVHPAVVNVGLNPTFVQSPTQNLSIEAHLLDFHGDTDVYGERMTIEFVDRLRDERKFDSVEELVRQIHSDIHTGRQILSRVTQKVDGEAKP